MAPPPGPIPEGPRSATYDVENSIGYMERVYMDSGRFDRLNQLKPQIDHAYNFIKSWEQQNDATTSFGMWFVADDSSGLVKLDKGQMALVVSMGATLGSNTVRISKTFTSDATIAIVATGLFNGTNLNSDAMFAQKAFTSSVNLISGDQLTVNWDISVSGSDTL